MNEGSGMHGLAYLLDLTRWWKLVWQTTAFALPGHPIRYPLSGCCRGAAESA